MVNDNVLKPTTMKNTVLSFLLLFSTTLFAGEPIETSSQIKDVMVYRTGARITRTAQPASNHGRRNGFDFCQLPGELLEKHNPSSGIGKFERGDKGSGAWGGLAEPTDWGIFFGGTNNDPEANKINFGQ